MGESNAHGATNTLIRVFGGVDLLVDGEIHGVGGPRQRRLLALLAVKPRQVVDVDWLSEYLWNDDDRPDATTGALRTYVSRLRGALPPGARDWVVTESGGYRLEAPASALENELFVSLRHQARLARETGDPERAQRLLDQALGMWRGVPFRELEDLDWVSGAVERLDIDRLEMLEERWETALDLGRHTQITGELAAFTAEHGHRERAARQYALALHRSGRTAEALRVIDGHRRLLSDSGVEPSAEMLEFEDALLSGDASLQLEGDAPPLRGYRLVERVGAGAFAVVWKAIQPSVDRLVAIKQIREELATQPDFIRRFELEAQMVARIEHPHIVPLIDFWRDPDAAYLVMRWLAGGTLERRLDGGPLTVPETLRIADQIGAGLTAAHAHAIVHRDVKSANVMFDDAGNAFLTDFGIALAEAESSGPAAALSTGSPAYAAPEQLRREPLGPASDVYSLAVVIYECLTGATPFADSANAAELIDRQLNAEPPLDDITRLAGPQTAAALGQALSKSPEDRFGSVEAFLDALRPSEASSGREPRRVQVGLNPYVGLRAFDVGDADRYFGRERLVAELLERLRVGDTASRALVVVGPSGSGKSSVVRAGLLPRLHRGDVEDSATWFTTTMIPGSDPFEALEAAMLRIAVNPPDALLDQLEDGPRGILRGVRRCLPSDRDVLLLTIDQFEELFLGRAAARADDFLDALSVAITDPTSPLRVVATLRADYYHRPLQHMAFAPILKAGAVEVTPLAPDELEEAIVGPARTTGVEFESGLVARIAAETIGQASPLPLLQHVLAALFEQREGRLLSVDAYERLGGVAGALAARAESIYAQSNDSERAAMRRVFGAMSDPGEDRPDLRRRIAVVDLGGDQSTRAVLDRFGDARLITFDRDPASREPTVEVAHEAVLREWPRLGEWLAEDRELLRSIERLAAAATVWDEGGRQDSDLLRGGRLAQALDLPGDAITRSLDVAYVEASRLQAEHDTEAERRRVARLRRLNAFVSVALVAALVAGAIAFDQRNEAQSAADLAEAATASAETAEAIAVEAEREAEGARADAEVAALVSRSQALAGREPDVSVLLALEAHRRDPTMETEGAVLSALAAVPAGATTVALPDASGHRCLAFENPLMVSADGRMAFTVVDDRLLTVDLDDGTTVDRGPAPGPCVMWVGDRDTDAAWATPMTDSGYGGVIGATHFRGSLDAPRDAIEPSVQNDPGEFRPGPLLWGGVRGDRVLIDTGSGDAALLAHPSGEAVAVVNNAWAFGVRGRRAVIDAHGRYAVFAQRSRSLFDDSVVVLDARSGELLHTIELPGLAVSALGVRGDVAVIGTDLGQVATIDLAEGRLVWTVGAGSARMVIGIGTRPDGLIVAATETRVELIDPQTGPIGIGMDVDAAGAVVRDDGRVTVVSTDLASASTVDLDTIAAAESILAVPRNGSPARVFDGRVALITDDGSVYVSDLDGAEVTTVQLPPDAPAALDALADRHGVVVFGEGGHIGRIEADEAVEFLHLQRDVNQVGFTQAGFGEGGPAPGALQADRGALALLPIPRSGYQGDVYRMSSTQEGLTAELFEIGFAPVSALPSASGGMHVLDPAGLLRTYDQDRSFVSEVATGIRLPIFLDASPDGRLVVAGSERVVVVDPTDEVVSPVEWTGRPAGVSFARQGDLLVLVDRSGTVALIDVATLEPIGDMWIPANGQEVSRPWFDAETDSIWVPGQGRVVEFSLDPARWVERACAFVGRELTPEEWSEFVPGDGPQVPACG